MTIITLTSEFAPIWLQVDAGTGTPIRVGATDDDGTPMSVAVTIVDGGVEQRGPDGGLVYLDTRALGLAPGTATAPRSMVDVDRRTYEIDVSTTDPETWRATWRFEFGGTAAPLAISLRLTAASDASIVRNLRLDTTVGTTTDGWRVHAPGNGMRCDLDRRELVDREFVRPMTGVEGSCGLVALECTGDRSATVMLWPASTTGIGEMFLVPISDGATQLTWQTDLAGAPGEGGTLTAGPLLVDHVPAPFDHVVATIPTRLAALGITSPNDPPEWARAANIYEVQIGFGVFPDGWTYSPYPMPEDLLADLDRIAALGYDVLQIMPRQPYPSYNVHDYADISTSYGDERVIRDIVTEAHARDMRVILDILLHGVVDQEVVREAIDGIERGPVAHKLDGPLPDITTLGTEEHEAVLITWSRHLLDFGPHWIAGSPERHPLVDQHPEWFCRDSSGHITSRYSRAFDLAHPGWQRYFIESCLELVRRLDIDGFRLDAPSYNEFHNWSERTRPNAAVSMLGALSMFDRLRVELRALKPECLLYTEPSGVLWRVAMDLNYDYDELFVMRALLAPEGGSPHWPRNARELARWLELRDAALPPGSLTAHCIDSHDSFWWPSPGAKWRREQFGLEATRAMLALFALSGEPYMTFVGGEIGLDETVTEINRLRRTHREFGVGRSDYRSVRVDDDRVYAVVRHGDDGTGLVLVNTANEPTSTTVVLDGDALGGRPVPPTTEALVGGPAISWTATDEGHRSVVHLPPYGFTAARLS